jgi:hypothetical protein
MGCSTSDLGQTRKSARLNGMSVLPPKDLYGAICVKTIRYGSSPCSAGLRHLLVPTSFSLGCCAQRRSRVGRRLIAERLALDGREHSGRLARSGCTPAPLATETIPRGSSPSCAQIARHELVFGRPVRIATTMQSCASAAKLREGGPILNRGARTIVQHRVAATSVHQLQHGIDKALGCSNSVVLMRPVAAAGLPASHRLSRAATAQ